LYFSKVIRRARAAKNELREVVTGLLVGMLLAELDAKCLQNYRRGLLERSALGSNKREGCHVAALLRIQGLTFTTQVQLFIAD
jgi:hypothetical protein